MDAVEQHRKPTQHSFSTAAGAMGNPERLARDCPLLRAYGSGG
jgi:hypothetical protein